MNGPLIQAIAEHVEVTAHAGHECTPEHLAAALQPLLDAEVERRVDAKVRLCARCGVREVVHIPGRMNCCDTCAVEVSNEVWADRVDAEKATAWDECLAEFAGTEGLILPANPYREARRHAPEDGEATT